MRRLIALIVLIAILFSWTGLIVTAQDATPAAEGAPSFEILGAAPSSVAPGNRLVLVQASFPPGFTDDAAHIRPADYVVAVQSGTLAFTIETGTLLVMRAGTSKPEPAPIGEEVTVGPGDRFAGTPDVVWSSERVVGDEPFVVIGTFLGTLNRAEPEYLDVTPAAAGTPAG